LEREKEGNVGKSEKKGEVFNEGATSEHSSDRRKRCFRSEKKRGTRRDKRKNLAKRKEASGKVQKRYDGCHLPEFLTKDGLSGGRSLKGGSGKFKRGKEKKNNDGKQIVKAPVKDFWKSLMARKGKGKKNRNTSVAYTPRAFRHRTKRPDDENLAGGYWKGEETARESVENRRRVQKKVKRKKRNRKS